MKDSFKGWNLLHEPVVWKRRDDGVGLIEFDESVWITEQLFWLVVLLLVFFAQEVRDCNGFTMSVFVILGVGEGKSTSAKRMKEMMMAAV